MPNSEIHKLAEEMQEAWFDNADWTVRECALFVLEKRLVPCCHSLPIEGELKLTNPKGSNP